MRRLLMVALLIAGCSSDPWASWNACNSYCQSRGFPIAVTCEMKDYKPCNLCECYKTNEDYYRSYEGDN